ncbi:MAG: methyltransferase domain-containing protein [Spirochaetes bacterium]|nr:methyltransferase domain-containing protein [Spirochaetota bacterium]
MNEETWNRISCDYYSEILSPLKDCKHNPLIDDLKALKSSKLTVIDLGCGLGELIPFLVENFKAVTATDFSPEMIAQALERNAGSGADFLILDMDDMSGLKSTFDVAIAVNSILSSDLAKLNRIIREIFKILKPGGKLFAILPAMESYIYQNMLFVDRELEKDVSQEKVIMHASKKLDHKSYDPFHGLINFEGDIQKAFYRFEILYRFGKGGFSEFNIVRVPYRWSKWKEAGQMYYPREDPPWDWYFTCVKPK